MSSPGYPDLHHARSAEGWLELGDPEEAALELRQVSRDGLGHPDVQEIFWRLHAVRRDWNAALAIARELTRTAPDRSSSWIHVAYCLHELDRTADAWTTLLPQADRFPEETTIAYNLACYACRLNRPEEARNWLGRAISLGGRGAIRRMALEDPDLEAMRDVVRSL